MKQQTPQPKFRPRPRGFALFALLFLATAVPGRALAAGQASPVPGDRIDRVCAHQADPDGGRATIPAAGLSAAPRPALAGWFSVGPSKRSRVVQVGALGMCLALFIIFRSAKY